MHPPFYFWNPMEEIMSGVGKANIHKHVGEEHRSQVEGRILKSTEGSTGDRDPDPPHHSALGKWGYRQEGRMA